LKTRTLYIAIAVGVAIVALTILVTYTADQGRLRGQYFGNSLQAIQDDLKQTQGELYSKKTMLDEKSITPEEFSAFADEHVKKMKDILPRYETLNPPESFVTAVEFFKISTQKQIESDELYIDWIKTNNTASKVRSDLLLQESFENEMAGLGAYNKAKNNAG
jgi:hypothetical protein